MLFKQTKKKELNAPTIGQAHRIKRGKLMNTIGIALISFGVGLIISLKLMKEDEKKRKRGKKDV
jgi:hypothetical protein